MQGEFYDPKTRVLQEYQTKQYNGSENESQT